MNNLLEGVEVVQVILNDTNEMTLYTKEAYELVKYELEPHVARKTHTTSYDNVTTTLDLIYETQSNVL